MAKWPKACIIFDDSNNGKDHSITVIIIIIIIIIFIYLLQLGCHPVAVVILHVNKHEIGYY